MFCLDFVTLIFIRSVEIIIQVVTLEATFLDWGTSAFIDDLVELPFKLGHGKLHPTVLQRRIYVSMPNPYIWRKTKCLPCDTDHLVSSNYHPNCQLTSRRSVQMSLGSLDFAIDHTFTLRAAPALERHLLWMWITRIMLRLSSITNIRGELWYFNSLLFALFHQTS